MTDPDVYFEGRGLALRVEQRNLDVRLPKYALTRGHTHWADLVSRRTGRVVAEAYGSGMTADEAKARARDRYIEEQEPSLST
jgi:hypothetical protein